MALRSEVMLLTPLKVEGPTESSQGLFPCARSRCPDKTDVPRKLAVMQQ